MGLTLRREIISSMDRHFDYSFCSYSLMLILNAKLRYGIYIYIYSSVGNCPDRLYIWRRGEVNKAIIG